jgi:cellulose synthase/poly-beta-1,6-N-acetylglucosamine synthase-like glycosyltransferase
MTLLSWLPVSLLGATAWGAWIVRQLLGAGYGPDLNDHSESTSVIVPVYREDLLVLERSLATWLRSHPDEVVLVIDHSEHGAIERARMWEAADQRIKNIVVEKPGKRHALSAGIRAARHDVVVLTDSDTLWADGFLRNLLMPFADPAVGGVGCRQNVLEPRTSIWRRVADWMLDVRFLHYLPAMARRKAIPCISGRTAAYRRNAVLPLLDDLEFETFWGRLCISGDDGRLTWLILHSGWKAAYQSSARAWTVFPNTFRGFAKQRIRWSRNSYRCYFRAFCNGWMWRLPLITPVSVAQNLLGPFTLLVPVTLIGLSIPAGRSVLAGAIALWLLVGRAIKGWRHISEHPSALLLLPVIALVFIVVMIPIKVYALLTLNRQGWVTRRTDEAVAEGQGSSTLSTSFGLADHITSTQGAQS